jgi:multidrug resistance efflux pump
LREREQETIVAASFSRTLRSLRSDDSRRTLLVALAGAVLIGAWCAWALFARIAVYESTPTARVEVEQASHAVQAPVAGRIVSSQVTLGREVAVGDVLYELDSAPQRLELGQATARLAAIGPELEAGKKELEAHAQAGVDSGQGINASVAEARAKTDEAKAAVKLAEEQLARAQRLRPEGLISQAELDKVVADLAQKRAAAEAVRISVDRIGASGRATLSDRKASKQSLAREIAALEGEETTTKALAARLEYEITRRVVRASVSGTIAEVGNLTVGSMVNEGDRMAAIVPAGTLRIIAEYAPAQALGRIRPGQRARLRLDGFPWAEHGTVSATVTRIASEVRDGKLRVELAINPDAGSIPLQHGLPGHLEVEVERAAPYALVLRAAGKLVEASPESEPPGRGGS